MVFLRRTRHTAILLLFATTAAAQAPSQTEPQGNRQQGPNQQQQPTQTTNGPQSPGQSGSNNVVVTIQTPSNGGQSDGGKTAGNNGTDDATGQFFSAISAGASVAQAIFAFVLLLLTGALIGVGWKQSTASAKQLVVSEAALATTREIERAYITIGHDDPVSLRCEPDSMGGQDNLKPLAIAFTYRVKNVGRTPGDVLGGFIGYHIGNEPTQPTSVRITNHVGVGFFLPDKSVAFPGTVINEPQSTLLELLQARSKKLWLIGEVDYIDRFDNLHTSGWARVLNPRDGIHPTFDPADYLGPFNFDKPMAPDRRKQYGKA